MFCPHCGKEISESSLFCKYCGKVLSSAPQSDESRSIAEENYALSGPEPEQNTSQDAAGQQSAESEGLEQPQSAENKTKEPLTLGDIGILIAVAVVGILLLILAIHFWMVTVFLGVAGIGIYWWVKASPKERTDVLKGSGKGIIKYAVSALIIVLLLALFVPKVRYWTDALISGKGVPISYLSAYSNSKNIGTAFYDFFDGGDWSNYKENGTRYVTFNGDYINSEGSLLDVEITFRVSSSGEGFSVYAVEINGNPVGWLIQEVMLETIFE